MREDGEATGEVRSRLHMACRMDRANVVKLLIRDGVDVDPLLDPHPGDSVSETPNVGCTVTRARCVPTPGFTAKGPARGAAHPGYHSTLTRPGCGDHVPGCTYHKRKLTNTVNWRAERRKNVAV